MKRTLAFILAAAALFVASCQIQEEFLEPEMPENETPAGVPMTFKVNLGEQTKTAYELDGNVLKATWAPGDSIAVVSFDSDDLYANVASIDKFALVSGSGTSSGEFTGYYTGGSAPRVMCFYPPISPYEYDELDMPKPEGYHGSKRINGAKGSNSTRAISQVKVGNQYIHFNSTLSSYASASGDLTPVKERSVLYGTATIDTSDPYAHQPEVTFQNLYSVLKVTAVLPMSLTTSDVIKSVEVSSTVSNSFKSNDNWGYAASPQNLYGGYDFARIYFGEINTNESDPTGINVPADRTVVFYLIADILDQPAATEWTVDATVNSGDHYTKTITFGSATSFDPGKMYRLTVNLEGTGSPAPPVATNLSPMNQTANCYVVASDSPAIYKIKNVKGTNFNQPNATAVSAVVLWESLANGMNTPSVGDIIDTSDPSIDNGIGIYDDGFVYFKTTGARGNAVIAVKDESDNILWSWHIWCTGASFNPTTDYYDVDTYLMMKVNLGAFSYAYMTGDSNGVGSTETAGLLYQFGRKDPFRGVKNLYADVDPVQIYTTNAANWNYVECTAETGTVAYAHAHPMTYIQPNRLGGWGNMDWVYTEEEELLARDRWTSSNDDPCPYGWRVMGSYDNMITWDKSDYILNTDKYAGMNFFLAASPENVDAYFPYAGYIDEDGHGIVQQYYDPRGYGMEDYFRYSGFYWTTSGGTTKYRQYMLIQDRCGYDDPSTMNDTGHVVAPIVTIKKTYNYYDMYTWGPKVGLGNAMSVRCIRNNN
ncbi:MAG: hypothetical protein J5382_03785 [Bacteroidales bacterium]|nr:hypothetical protein [Bacteroidales bacterium]